MTFTVVKAESCLVGGLVVPGRSREFSANRAI